MISDSIRFCVPGEVEEPSTLQVVPIAGITPPGGATPANDPAQGYTGTALTLRRGPDSHGEHLGFVVACPQVPRWMSPEYAKALEEERNGEIQLDDYANEWFEKIIYVGRQDLDAAAKAHGGLSWTKALASLGPVLDSATSDGCSTVTARTQVYRVSLRPDGTPGAAHLDGVFYTLVWDHLHRSKLESPALVTEIALAPLEARKHFVAGERHKHQLAESSRLARIVDPKGDKAKLRAEHHRVVRGREKP